MHRALRVCLVFRRDYHAVSIICLGWVVQYLCGTAARFPFHFSFRQRKRTSFLQSAWLPRNEYPCFLISLCWIFCLHVGFDTELKLDWVLASRGLRSLEMRVVFQRKAHRVVPENKTVTTREAYLRVPRCCVFCIARIGTAKSDFFYQNFWG
jgi:hypothetical protein